MTVVFLMIPGNLPDFAFVYIGCYTFKNAVVCLQSGGFALKEQAPSGDTGIVRLPPDATLSFLTRPPQSAIGG